MVCTLGHPCQGWICLVIPAGKIPGYLQNTHPTKHTQEFISSSTRPFALRRKRLTARVVLAEYHNAGEIRQTTRKTQRARPAQKNIINSPPPVSSETSRTAQHSIAQHSIAQHSIAQHSIAQHSIAQHSNAPQNTNIQVSSPTK